MTDLIVSAWTADLSSPENLVKKIVDVVQSSWDQGAEVVVLPEFLWMGLPQWQEGLPAGAAYFWLEIWPVVQSQLSRPGKCVVLGTCPCHVNGGLVNRAAILSDGQSFVQDKQILTPWEKDFQRGDGLLVWEFQGWRLAVLVCLDVEIPEHSVQLRREKVDLLLVPSATESLLGVERIGRCASARAVEIGCYVVVSHLVGTSDAELVDEQIGRLSCYTPSQRSFLEKSRTDEGPLVEMGWHERRFDLSARALQVMRRSRLETNPALMADGASAKH